MAQNTAIEWCDHTFNPWRGCSKISPGCANCYADRQSRRNPKVLGVWGQGGSRVLASGVQWKWVENRLTGRSLSADRRRAFVRDGRRQRVFCASLADVFEDWPGQMSDSSGEPLFKRHDGSITPYVGRQHGLFGAPRSPYTLDDARERLWDVIRNTPELDWLLLTKRPENVRVMMPGGVWPNVWLGTSVEGQDYAWRIDALLEAAEWVKCPVRFVSAEPLIGPLDVRQSLSDDLVNWLIVGGESGAASEARPFCLEWGYDLVRQCRDAEVPVFAKQSGVKPMILLQSVGGGGVDLGMRPSRAPNLEGDKKDTALNHWSVQYKVRQFPKVKAGAS